MSDEPKPPESLAEILLAGDRPRWSKYFRIGFPALAVPCFVKIPDDFPAWFWGLLGIGSNWVLTIATFGAVGLLAAALGWSFGKLLELCNVTF